MGFPTSVQTFTTKNANDPIQASHVNDLQTEVVAIEGALINGPLTIGGATTFTASPTLPRWPACKVTHDVVQQIADNTYTGLSWNTELNDAAAMHSTASNSSRITLNSSGVWLVGANIPWLGNTTPTHDVRIHVNDDYVLAQHSAAAFSLDPFVHAASGIHVTTSTTEYVTVQVRAVGSTARVNANSTALNIPAPSFWAVRLSQ